MRDGGQEEEESRRGEEEDQQEEEIGTVGYRIRDEDLRGKGVRQGGQEEKSCRRQEEGGPQEKEEIGVPRWGEGPPSCLYISLLIWVKGDRIIAAPRRGNSSARMRVAEMSAT